MIGDRKFDIAGGKEHGLTTVGVTFGYAEEENWKRRARISSWIR